MHLAYPRRDECFSRKLRDIAADPSTRDPRGKLLAKAAWSMGSFTGHGVSYSVHPTPRSTVGSALRPPLRGAAPERATSGLLFLLAIALFVGSTATAGVVFFDPERQAPAAQTGPFIPVPMDPTNAPPAATEAPPSAGEAAPEPAPTVAKVKRKKKAKKPVVEPPPPEPPPVNPYDRI